jgi:hypothetical protein
MFRAAVVLVSSLAIATVLFAAAATVKPATAPTNSAATAKPAVTANSAAPAKTVSGVKVWEEKVTIPTYLLGEPNPNPQFYFGGNSQGAQHRIYPYPEYDNLTTEKKDKTYTMVYLENEYVKIGILPEIGGKIFTAVDKTNGYDFIYNQHVIKPALISLLGAWLSGGIEWDLPHHHRATSFLPMQYKVEENADGSKTVWIGELELRDRMDWTVGVTLFPGKTYMKAAFRMINRTPVPTSMLSDLSAEHAVCDLSRQDRLHDVADRDDQIYGRGLYVRGGCEPVQEPHDGQQHVRVELQGGLLRGIRPREERGHHERGRP